MPGGLKRIVHGHVFGDGTAQEISGPPRDSPFRAGDHRTPRGSFKGTWGNDEKMSTVSVEVVFETHSWSEDNDRGLASGWSPGRLSPRGRALARELGRRRQHDGLSAVFSSDLRRATETAELAFTGGGPPTFADWRLRECDFGELNGAHADRVHADRRAHLYDPYPGGESWAQAVGRAAAALADIAERRLARGSS